LLEMKEFAQVWWTRSFSWFLPGAFDGVFVEEFYLERKGICFPIVIIETWIE
jgi:hypothetical protein